MPAPSVGRTVHYKVSATDADQINRRRADAQAFRSGLTQPVEPGGTGRSGHIEHHGNQVTEGDVYPAVIVRVFSPESTTVNLQVSLDGNDHFWATSRQEGEDPGNWSWPPRV